MSVLAGLAAAGAMSAVNNMMADSKATTAFKRQKQLMQLQSYYNNAANVNAPSQLVEGQRLAGLNPAMADSQSAPVASVSSAAAPQAENVEMSPTDILTIAQAKNLDADTAKKQSETKNVDEDTELKFVQKLYTGANEKKVREEAQSIKNLNDQYSDTNRGLKEFGRGMAEKWQSESWFDKLGPQTKDTIDSIAAGDMPLTIGGMSALMHSIEAQKALSDADRALVKNAFDNAITEAMFSDESVMSAISHEPKNIQDKLIAERDRIKADTEKIRYKMKELIDSDLSGKKLSNDQLDAIVKSFKRGNLDYLKSQGEYGRWLEGYAEQMLLRIVPLVSGAAVAKGFTGQSKSSEPSMIVTPGSKDFTKTISDINKTHGVQSFHF